jgi:hypothetical protein
VRVRDLAKLIGQLSATRAQHDEASLYLAKLNWLKSRVVNSAGWDATTRVTRAVLPELAWWRRALHDNTPNDIRPFENVSTIYTDASETGWGATLRRLGLKARWMFGWWVDDTEINCMRELNAVVIAVTRAHQKELIHDGDDVLIRSDNTNVVYNLDRKRAGWRMRAKVKDFVRWLKARRIRLRCRHVAGTQNGTADSLSRLSKSGDYSLREGVLAQIETALGAHAEIDLFATSQNRLCTRYATVEDIVPDGRTVLARDAMTIPWNFPPGWTALVHPPIPLLTRVLAKIRRNGTRAILVMPSWRGAAWMQSTRKMMLKPPVILGNCSDLLTMSAEMRRTRAALPPGKLMAVLVQGDAT